MDNLNWFNILPSELFYIVLTFLSLSDVVLLRHVSKSVCISVNSALDIRSYRKKKIAEYKEFLSEWNGRFDNVQIGSFNALSTFSSVNLNQFIALMNLKYNILQNLHWLPPLFFPSIELDEKLKIDEQVTFTKKLIQLKYPINPFEYLRVLSFKGNVGLFDYFFHHLDCFKCPTSSGWISELKEELRHQKIFSKLAIQGDHIEMLSYLYNNNFDMDLSLYREAIKKLDTWKTYFDFFQTTREYNQFIKDPHIFCHSLKVKNYECFKYLYAQNIAFPLEDRCFWFAVGETGNLNCIFAVFKDIKNLNIWFFAGLAKGGHLQLLLVFLLLNAQQRKRRFSLLTGRELWIECSAHPEFDIKITFMPHQECNLSSTEYWTPVTFTFVSKQKRIFEKEQQEKRKKLYTWMRKDRSILNGLNNSSILNDLKDSSVLNIQEIESTKKRTNQSDDDIFSSKKPHFDIVENSNYINPLPVQNINQNSNLSSTVEKTFCLTNVDGDKFHINYRSITDWSMEQEKLLERSIIDSACEGGQTLIVKIAIEILQMKGLKLLEYCCYSGSFSLLSYLTNEDKLCVEEIDPNTMILLDLYCQLFDQNFYEQYYPHLPKRSLVNIWQRRKDIRRFDQNNQEIKEILSIPNKSSSTGIVFTTFDVPKTNELEKQQREEEEEIFKSLNQIKFNLKFERNTVFTNTAIQNGHIDFLRYISIEKHAFLGSKSFYYAVESEDYRILRFLKDHAVPIHENAIILALDSKLYHIVSWLILVAKISISNTTRDRILRDKLCYHSSVFISSYYSQKTVSSNGSDVPLWTFQQNNLPKLSIAQPSSKGFIQKTNL